MGKHASDLPPDPAAEWRSIWHVTWEDSQGQEIEIAPWLRGALRVLINGTLGVVVVGALVFSSYQLINSSPVGLQLGIELGAVPFVSGVPAGEARRRRRHAFGAAAQTAYILVSAALAAGLPVLLHFSLIGDSSVNGFSLAALLVEFVFGLLVLSLRFGDFQRPE